MPALHVRRTLQASTGRARARTARSGSMTPWRPTSSSSPWPRPARRPARPTVRSCRRPWTSSSRPPSAARRPARRWSTSTSATTSTARPSRPAVCKETVAALRENTGLVVQLSTGGSVHDPLDARLAVLDAEPDSCSLTMGTVNFGDDVFMNPWGFICDLYQASQDKQVVPEFELFDLGHVHSLARLLRRYGLPYGGRVHCRPRHERPRRHERHRRRPRRRGGRAAARDDVVVGHRHRPLDADRRAGRAVQGRPPARRHGGRPHAGQGRPGRAQRAAGDPRRRARSHGAARADDARPRPASCSASAEARRGP